MTARRVEIVVDELVLRGVAPEQAEATAAALRLRLGVLGEGWARSGLPLPPRDEASRRLPPVTVAAASPAALGDAVARSVWSGLAGGGRA